MTDTRDEAAVVTPLAPPPPPLVRELTVQGERDGGDGTLLLPSGRAFHASADTLWLVRQLARPIGWDALAARLTRRLETEVSADQARALVNRLIVEPGITVPGPGVVGPQSREVTQASDARGVTVLPAAWTRRLSAAMVPVLRRDVQGAAAAAAIAAHLAWLSHADVVDRCLGQPLLEIAWAPAVLIPALLAHELGHAAACRAHGGRAGTARMHGPRPRLTIELHGLERMSADERVAVFLGGAVAQLLWGAAVIAGFAAFRSAPPALGLLANLLTVAANLAPIGDRDGARVAGEWAGVPSAATGPQVADARGAVRYRALATAGAGMLAVALGVLVATRVAEGGAGGWAAWVVLGASAAAAVSFARLCVRLLDQILGHEPDGVTEAAPLATRMRAAVLHVGRQLRVVLAMAVAGDKLRRERALLSVLASFAFPERSSSSLKRLGRRSVVSMELLHREHGDLARGGLPHVLRHAHVVRRLIDERRGAVICGLHFGPFHYLVRALLRMGIQPVVFAARSTQSHWDDTWQRAIGPKEFDPHYLDPRHPAAALRAFRALRAGRLIVVYMDAQIAAGGGDERRVPVRFLGQTLYMRSGPMVLARRAGVPIVLGATPRRALGMRLVAFSDLLAPPSDDVPETIARYLADRYAWFEPWVARYPEQWAGNLLRLDHWREAGSAPRTSAAEWQAERAAWGLRLERPGRARLALDSARVGWIEIQGERLIVDGPGARVLKGAPLTLELLEAAARGAPIARLVRSRRPDLPVAAIVDELSRLTLAGLVTVREARGAPSAPRPDRGPAIPA